MEEERRLAYVASTRAKDKLFVSFAGGRNLDGSVRFPSRFVLDMGKDNLEFIESIPQETASRVDRLARAQQLMYSDDPSALKPGQRVLHSIFGEGTVLSLDRTTLSYMIKFDRIGTPRSISSAAKIEII